MKKPLHILALAGSLRQESVNQGLLRAAKEMLPDDVQMEIFDLAPIPLFNLDLKTQGEPQAVLAFKQRIAAADALLIATPEYNASIPGVLKNALDWASHPRSQSPLAGKPLAIIGAGGRSGTIHAQRHLREIATHLNMRALPDPDMLVRHAWEKFDSQGNLIDDQTRSQLADLLAALAAWIQAPDVQARHQPAAHALPLINEILLTR